MLAPTAAAAPYLAPAKVPALTPPAKGLLPAHLASHPTNHFLVGLALERYGHKLGESDTQLGLVGAYRAGPFSPHFSLLIKPGKLHRDFEDSRWLLGLGTRSYFELLGLEWSYGVGAHVEARLEDHFWLAFLSPAELGVVIHRRNSWQLELFGGARRAFAGDLINSYLVDPNGFNNESAREELKEVRYSKPWRAFLRLVFSRRLD